MKYIIVDLLSRLDYDEKINTCNINIHIRNMTLAHVSKKTNSKAFQTDNVYVPPSTVTFTRNHPEPTSTREATKRTI